MDSEPDARDLMRPLPVTVWGNLSKPLNLSVPRLPPMENRDDDEGRACVPKLLEGWHAFLHMKVLARWLDIASARSSFAMSVILFWAFTGRGSRCVLRDAEARAETNGCKPLEESSKDGREVPIEMGLLSLDCRGGGKRKRNSIRCLHLLEFSGRDQERGRLWKLQILLAEDKGKSEENKRS